MYKDEHLENIRKEFGPLAERLSELGMVSCFGNLDYRTVTQVLNEIEPREDRDGKGVNVILIKNSTKKVLHHKRINLPKAVRQEIFDMSYSIDVVNVTPHSGYARGYILLEIHYTSPEKMEALLKEIKEL